MSIRTRLKATFARTSLHLGRPLETLLPRGEIAIFHEFHRPPYGGGNQFLLALKQEFEIRGVTVSVNQVGRRTRAVLFNSFNFDFHAVARLKDRGFRLVHRVDGPISIYRGEEGSSTESVDNQICRINEKIADRTILQSQYSLRSHEEMGLQFRQPTVIPNAVNPRIFYPSGNGRTPTSRLRVIASAWSSNPKKGLSVYRWLDENLDPKRFDFTFVGQIQHRFQNFRQIDPVPSENLAELLRKNDVYLTASENDPCSNALIEALSCGLPAVYKRSGGHPELVGNGGLGFDEASEIPVRLETLRERYSEFRHAIRVAPLPSIAEQYLEVLLSGTR
jgi:glycosyltransferase involved in cell wall biosynthesis